MLFAILRSMNRDAKIEYLIEVLKKDNPEASGLETMIKDRRLLLRALMNITMPYDLPPSFYEVQDELLAEERKGKRLHGIEEMNSSPLDTRLLLFKGDITTIKADAVVNAANSALLGCFHPLHNCIDNIIHSAAGLEVRRDLIAIMEKQGHEEETGKAKITKAYALPSKYIIHTVGPIVNKRHPEKEDEDLLSSCYRSSLTLLDEYGLETIAFPCISTGVFGYPKREAAKTAVSTVREFLDTDNHIKKVIFNVFEEEDERYYRNELGL